MLQEQEQKLRQEYLGLGGSANSPIPNYFLYIIIGISFLAVRVVAGNSEQASRNQLQSLVPPQHNIHACWRGLVLLLTFLVDCVNRC